MIDQIKSIHALYGALTSNWLHLDMNRERIWYEFLKRFTEEDLRLVIAHLQTGIKKGYRYMPCLRFSRLIEPLDHFEEQLNEARANSRNNKPQSNREQAIKVLRPQTPQAPQIDNSKPISEIMPELLKKMREAAK